MEKVYQTLMEEHRTLQSNLDDAVSEKEDALSQLRQAQRDADNRKPDGRNDAIMRAEIDRLRSELYVNLDYFASNILIEDIIIVRRVRITLPWRSPNLTSRRTLRLILKGRLKNFNSRQTRPRD